MLTDHPWSSLGLDLFFIFYKYFFCDIAKNGDDFQYEDVLEIFFGHNVYKREMKVIY
jgi:hypothetical protein